MSGSLLASAPPLTVIQKNGANGATGATYDQADTHDQAPPRCPRDLALPRPHAEKEKKGVEHVNVSMQDPTRLTSTALQTCDRQTRHPPSTLFTGATQKASNSFGNKASDPCRPHAFLAGLNQSAVLAQKPARKEECLANNSRARRHTQFTSTDASPAARNGESRKAATCKPLAFLAGPGRTIGQLTRCEARNERAPTPQRARPPTPSSGSATNSAASPRRARIRELLHTLQGCCDGQQHGSSNALRARLPVTMRASAHRVLSHMMMEMTTIVMIMMRLIAKMNLTMSAIMTMIATSGSNSPRGSRRYPAPEPKHEPAGPSPAPAALCTRTRAAQATQPVPPKPSENGITYQSSAAEAAATHSSISRRHAAKPALKAEQTSILGTGVEDRPALTTTDAIDSQNGNSLKLIKSTVGRDYWLAGQLTEQTTRSTCTTKNTRAREQPKHDKQQNAQPPDFAALAAAARRALAATALAIMNLRETETE